MSLIICLVGQRLWRPELHVSSFVRGTQPGLDAEFVTAECKDASAGPEVTTVSQCFILPLPGTLLVVFVFFASFVVFPFARLLFWQSCFFSFVLGKLQIRRDGMLLQELRDTANALLERIFLRPEPFIYRWVCRVDIELLLTK